MLPALFSPGDRDQTQRMTPSLGPALMNYPLACASRFLAFVLAASRAGASSSRDWASAPDANGAPTSGPDRAGFGISPAGAVEANRSPRKGTPASGAELRC